VSSAQQPPSPQSGLPQPPIATAPPLAPRPPQRRSIFSGLLLIFLGVLFLLFRFDPELRLGHLIWRFWPVIIIIWGIAKLVDHLASRNTGERTTVLTGSEAGLLILVIFCLAGVGLADWLRHRHDFNFNFHPFAERYSQSEALPATKIPPGAHITIQTAHGNVSVHVGGGNDLRVTVNKSTSDPHRSGADERMSAVKTIVEQSGNSFTVHATHEEDWEGTIEADLDVEVPKTASVAVKADHGDITVAGVGGAVAANAGKGDIDVHDAGSDVSATLSSGNLRISDVAGNVRVDGRGSEVDVSDVAGDAAFNGEFFGPIRVRNVSKTTRYLSERSTLSLTHMTGRLELNAGGIEVSDVAGPVSVAAHNKDIEVENVSGPLELADSHGDITIRCARAPSAPISVTDESGEIALTLPAKSAFLISAVSQSGEVDSEFQDPSLQLVNDAKVGRLSGKVGAGGPKITIATTYGTISLRKGS
jgi:DUF4097 and DUF4098 domain-containing protein YvlB